MKTLNGLPKSITMVYLQPVELTRELQRVLILIESRNIFFFFWENYLNRHFDEEEKLLFIKINDHKISEALQQHDNIRTIIKKLQSGVTYEFMLLQQFAEKLENQIRYEERILFPHFEKILTGKELKSIGLALEKSHPVATHANYADEFFGYHLSKR